MDNKISLHDAFEHVMVTPEQANMLFHEMADQYTEAPELRKAFLDAADAVIAPEPEPEAK